MKFRILCGLWIALLALALAGCGGSGGSSSGGASPANVNGVFATNTSGAAPASSVKPKVNTFWTSYSHIWVTVKEVIFDGKSSGAVIAYNDPTGTQLDLHALRDGSGGLYSLLGTASLPNDSYTDVKIVLDKGITLIANGSTTAVSANTTFAGLDAGGLTKTLTVNLGASGVTITKDFEIDFKVDQWTYDSGTDTVTTTNPGSGDGTGVGDPTRHQKDDFRGAVGNLTGTAPTQSFTLTRGDDQNEAVTVNCSALTTIVNGDGSPNPALANGQHVIVEGYFDTTARAIVASTITIRPATASGDDPAIARGTGSAGSLTDTGGTFTLALTDVEGFIPGAAAINVTTSTTTQFFTGRGGPLDAATFYGGLASYARIVVAGTWTSGTSTLAATKVIAFATAPSDDGVEAAGPTSNATLTGFDLTANQFEGLNITAGTLVHVTLGGSVQIFDPQHNSINPTQLLALLTGSTPLGVEVHGTYDTTSNTITATRVNVRPAPGTHPVVVFSGPLVSVDGSTNFVTVTVVNRDESDVQQGAQVQVNFGDTTVFYFGGSVVTKSSFLGSAQLNHSVRVIGSVTAPPSSSTNAQISAIAIYGGI